MRGDLLVAVEGDVFDEQADHAFALALGGGGIVPEPREVAGERHHLRALLLAEASVAVRVRAFVVILGFGEAAQLLVPVGLERVGDEPVVGVDGEVAAAREPGLIAGALDVSAGAAGRPRSARCSSSAATLSATSSATGVSVSSSSEATASSTPAPGIDLAACSGRALDRFVLTEVVGDSWPRRWW